MFVYSSELNLINLYHYARLRITLVEADGSYCIEALNPTNAWDPIYRGGGGGGASYTACLDVMRYLVTKLPAINLKHVAESYRQKREQEANGACT